MAIIQQVDPPDIAPLSNRGNVAAKTGIGHYSPSHSLSYWHPYTGPDFTASVDMVRLSYNIDPHGSPDIGVELADWWTRCYCDKVDYWPSVKPNQFQTVFTLYWGHWLKNEETGVSTFDKENAVSMTVGAGYIESDGTHDACKGFVEFNPNKVGKQALAALCGFSRLFDARLDLVRWDYAVDIPESRSDVLMFKDRRKYECHISDSITTYLGQRNTPGRVKVYDKQRESGLPVPVTRIEVTYPRPILADDGGVKEPTRSFWPLVGRAASTNSAAPVRTSVKMAVQALLALHQMGQDLQPYLQLLDNDTRARYKRLLVPVPVDFNFQAWSWCARHAISWENPSALAAQLDTID